MNNPVHIILDDTAMVAAGRGNVIASRLIRRAHAEPGWFLYAPACALVEADRARPGTAEHIAAQPSPDRPEGGVIATTTPDTWKGQPVRVLDLNP